MPVIDEKDVIFDIPMVGKPINLKDIIFFDEEEEKVAKKRATEITRQKIEKYAGYGEPLIEAEKPEPYVPVAEKPKVGTFPILPKPVVAEPTSTAVIQPQKKIDIRGIKSEQTVLPSELPKKLPIGEKEQWLTGISGDGKIYQAPPLNAMDQLREWKDKPEQFVPFLNSAVLISELAGVAVAAYRLNNGKETEKDKILLGEFSNKVEKDKTFWYGVLDIVSHIPAFAGEFMLTSGLYKLGKKATEKVATESIEALLKKSGKELLEKRIAQTGMKIGTGIAGATLQAPAVGALRTVEETLRRTIPVYSVSEGKVIQSGEKPLTALINANAINWVEVVSEHSGGILGHMAKYMPENAMTTAIASAFKKINPSVKSELFQKIAGDTAFHGMWGESFEERIGEIGRAVLGLEKYKLPSPTQIAQELIAFAIPGVAGRVIEKAGIVPPTEEVPTKEIIPEVEPFFTKQPQKPSEISEPTITTQEPEITQPEKPLQTVEGKKAPHEMTFAEITPTVKEAEIPEKPPVVSGKKGIASTEKGTKIDYDYTVYEADEYLTSHDENLRVNKDYPEIKQPRDRSKIASEVQIQKIEKTLMPERLGENPMASEGAPVVDKSAIVEAGNARVIALKRLYKGNKENAQKYKNWLIENAEKFGLDPEKIKSMSKPILTRRRLSDVDITKFIDEANIQATAAMSATEQALSDAKRLSDEALGMFIINETGEINTASNRDFMKRFVGEIISETEYGRYITKEGFISQEGVNRIRNAIYAKAFGNPETIERLSESTDDNIKNITKAMVVSAPKFAILKSEIKKGNRHDYDITKDIAGATDKLSFLREEGTAVEEYMAQGILFDDGVSNLAKSIIEIFDNNKRSTKKIVGILQNYIKLVDQIGNPNQENLFDVYEKPTKEELLIEAIKGVEKEDAQISFLEGKTARVGEISEVIRKKIGKIKPEEKIRETVISPEKPILTFYTGISKNYGKYELAPTTTFDEMGMETAKFKTRQEINGLKKEGVSFIVGAIEGKQQVQEIRFDKNKIDEVTAQDWWNENKDKITEIQTTGIIPAEKITAENYETKLETWYQKNLDKQKVKGERGFIAIGKEKPITQEAQSSVSSQIDKMKAYFDNLTKDFRFYKDAPKELRNDIRTDVIGAMSRIRNKIYNKTAIALFGDLDKSEVSQAVELIYARNQLSRAKFGKGDPTITIEEAQRILNDIEKSITNSEITNSADKWNEITEYYFNDLVRRGKLDETNKIEDYAPIYVKDYTPDWAFNVGIPSRLKRPFRGYVKKAIGTKKEYRKDTDTLLGHLLSIEHDNVLEDFITKQANKYDIVKNMTEEQKIELFGYSERKHPIAGIIQIAKSPRPNRIYEIEGEKYYAYNPDIPFTRQIFPLEVEDKVYAALGGLKKTYLLPKNIYDTFMSFSERGGSKYIYPINRAIGIWKSMAILSRFIPFNINNLAGDTLIAFWQCPQPNKLLREIDDSLSYLTRKPQDYSGFQKRLDKYILNNSILDSAFTTAELPYIRESKNPMKYLLRKSWQFSMFREEIMRTALASYFLKAIDRGEGETIRQYYNWIDTEDLTTEKGLGKIARDTVGDYNWMSKTFRRYVRGAAMPFSTWYLKMSPLLAKWYKNKPLKASLLFLSLPVMANLLNYRNDEYEEMEKDLPDGVRHNFHIIIGETPEGNIKTWSLQLFQDALIGTKVFSIATNEAFRVMNGEKPLKEAAVDTIKQWGIKEAEGILYLTNFVVRYIQGLIQQRDPFDGSSIYPTDKRRMSASDIYYNNFLYFMRCSVPPLSLYIREYSRGKTPSETAQELTKNFIGLPAWGIREYNRKAEIVLPDGTIIDWDTHQEMQERMQKEAKIFISIQDSFIRLGLPIKEYIISTTYQKYLDRLKELHGDLWNNKEFRNNLNDRIKGSMEGSSRTMQEWAQNNFDKAKTPEEKKFWNQEINKYRNIQLIKGIRQLPKSVRYINEETTEEE